MKTLNNKSTIKVNKTKKILEDALGALLEEKPFEEIRVIDICSKANMHRSTFYTYFNMKQSFWKIYKDTK